MTASSDFKTGSLKIGGGLTLTSLIAPVALDGTRKDNYAPTDAISGTGLPLAHVVSQGASAATDVSGFSATGLTAGFEFDFHNVSAFNLRLLHQDSNSSSGNKLTLPGSVNWTLTPGSCARIRYTGSGFRMLFTTTQDFPSLFSGGVQVTTNAYANNTHYNWKTDHLLTPQITNVPDGPFNMSFTGAGAGFTAATNPGRNGVVVAATGTTTTGRASANTGTSIVSSIASVITFQAAIGVPTLDDGVDKFTILAGLFQTVAAVDQTAGAYVLLDRNNIAVSGPNGGNAQKLSLWSVSASTRTAKLLDGTGGTVDTPVAARTWPSTNILNVRLVYTIGVSLAAYVNDVLRGTITTNLPDTTSLQAGWSILKNAGANSRSMEVDYTELNIEEAAVRATP